jgi:hypothetical protein
MPFLDLIGAVEGFKGTFQQSDKGGTLKVYCVASVVVFSASGQFLDALRKKGVFNNYLAAFFPYSHRISRLDASVDFRADAPTIQNDVYELGQSGQLHLTRKAVNSDHVSRLQGRNKDGYDTGTVYLGSKANSDVYAKVYDKRQERLAKGYEDIGPTLRIELTIQSDIGATLKDASNPFDIFYNFASKSLVIAPPEFKGWTAHGAGFDLPKVVDNRTTWERLWGIASSSNDLSRMIDLAVTEYGDDALTELNKLVRKRFTQFKKGLI